MSDKDITNCDRVKEVTITVVIVNKKPAAAFSMDPKELSEYAPKVTLTNESAGKQLLYEWTFEDGNPMKSFSKNTIYTYSQPGTYSICLKATDSLTHCADTVCNNILYNPQWSLFVPNAFTPDKNNVNDVFLAKGTNLFAFHLFIFDRWGNKIFESENIDKGWDGKVNNELVKQDTYIWEITCTDVFGKEHQYIGRVTLINSSY